MTDDRIRVAYLLSGLRQGGAEKQMLALAERLPRDRFDVSFLALIGESLYDDRAKMAGATVEPLGSAPDPGASRARAALRKAAKVFRYASTARRERYDIVDAWLYPADVVAALTRPYTRARVVISGRRNVDPHDLFGPLDPILDRMVDRLSDVVVANSSAAAAHAISRQRIREDKVRVIRNGVLSAARPTADARRALRADWDVGDDQFAIGCVGSLSPVKRQRDVVAAFARLIPFVPHARLVFIGDGSLREALQRQVDELGLGSCVRFLGGLAEPAPLYHAFDLLVQGSEREGLPNVLLEAAAASLPIVATDAGGSSEVVIDGETGVLIPVGDVDGMATEMRRLIDAPELRSRLGAAGRAHVESRFGMDRFVTEFAALYEEMVQQARS